MSMAVDAAVKLERPLLVESLHARAQLEGEKKAETGAFDEDSVLRVGLVVPGERRLSWLERMLAPAWIRELHALAPEGSGIDHVEFFMLSNRASLQGASRVHPKSELVRENVVGLQEREGAVRLDYTLKQPLKAVAVWIAVDGDDTKSQYTLTLEQLELGEKGGAE